MVKVGRWMKQAPNTGYLRGKTTRLLESSWRRVAGATRWRKGYRVSNYGGARGHLLAFNETVVCGYTVYTDNWGGGKFQWSELFGKLLNGKGLVAKDQGWSMGKIPPATRYDALLLANKVMYIAGEKNVYDGKPEKRLKRERVKYFFQST